MRANQKEYISGLIEEYLDKLSRRKRVSPNTISDYRRELWRMTKALDEAGMEITPKKIGEEEIEFILTEYAGHLRPRTQKWYVGIMSGYLKTYKNHVVAEMMLGWPSDARVNVDWLSLEEAVALIDSAEGVTKVLVHLELRLMMRRIEVKRLTAKDVHLGVLQVHGKGFYGGKWRTLAWAMESAEVLQEWMDARELMVNDYLDSHPGAPVCPNFLVHRMANGSLRPYSDTGLDKLLIKAAEKAGIDRQIGHHTLRRSGARFVIQADPDNMPVLVEALGHESEVQTRRYCALTIDDMTKMHSDVSQLLRQARESMKATGKRPAPPPVRIVA